MTNPTNPPDDLQNLWDELNQPPQERQQQDLAQRLQQRAAQYAAIQTDEQADANTAEMLIFRLGGERYALDIAVVRGVRPLERMTRVPGVPSFYRGVVNVRGQIRSVLDLRYFFQLEAADRTEQAAGTSYELVLVEANDLHLALLADHIEDVTTIPQQDIEPIDLRYARGVTPDQLVLLDASALFSDDRLLVGQSNYLESNGENPS